jgi:hypothetical protein
MWRVKIIIDGRFIVVYDRGNTGKEVIQKRMSFYHSEVAGA